MIFLKIVLKTRLMISPTVTDVTIHDLKMPLLYIKKQGKGQQADEGLLPHFLYSVSLSEM
ncbi:MAG: hypothetical protein EA357_05480 [Micavibrio sp.]|nr:MAG: hypothetical protein EA357_05480 [Micavibrio sp.]